MTQNFSFETNIEKRMPDTGKVFMVDRMTSDYAKAHPFNVDEYIESVYQKFAGSEFEESREAMKKIWTAVLSVTSPRGDASLYPNKNDEHHPALMEVWSKAGDYWRRGFRTGDLLPAIVPGCKITRLDNGEWIALFPKDAHLMSDGRCQMEESEYSEPAKSEESVVENTSAVSHLPSYVEQDLFAQMQMQIDRLQHENQELKNKQCNMIQTEATRRGQEPSVIEDGHRCSSPRVSPTQRRRRAVVVEQVIDDEKEGLPVWVKYLGGAVATIIALVVIFKTGLLIPTALVGLGLSGLLKA